MRAQGVALWGMALLFSSLLSLAAGAAEPSAGKALSEVARLCNTVQSLSVRYRAFSNKDTDVRGSYLERVILVQSPCFLYHSSGHGHAELSVADDPLRQETYVQSDSYYHVNPLNRTYFWDSLSSKEPLPGTLNEELFFHATALWPLPSRPAPAVLDGPYMLSDLSSSERYRFSEVESTTIDGVRCKVIERDDGADRLWLDLTRGYCLLRRELRDPKRNTLAARYDLRNHVEVLPRVWLPQEIHNKQYDYLRAANGGSEGRPVIDSFLKVLELEVSSINLDTFCYDPPAGSLERYLDPLKEPVQTQPGGRDHLESLVRWVRRTSVAERIQKPAKKTGSWIVFGRIVLGCVCVIVAIESCLLRR